MTEDALLSTIFNFRRLSERLITSGLPTANELRAVAEAGSVVDISLLPCRNGSDRLNPITWRPHEWQPVRKA